ncbi:glycosyltransferase family 29 protein [Halalkalibacter lacteus]|uniref:glycosyltransferase family 29 protein n=1 Tax=Halalkalibacter lacteus TaxID=3090663 RepID=UPI002FCBBA90
MINWVNRRVNKYGKKVLKKLNSKKVESEKVPYIEIGDNWADHSKPIAYMFGFNPWKRDHISHFFPEYRTAYVFGSAGVNRLKPYFKNSEDMVFIVWGFKEDEEILTYAKENNIKLIRVEDGFVRSMNLGAGHSLPMSIVTDDKTLYFNSREPSRLEEIFETYDFHNDPQLLEKARVCMEQLIHTGISKYNHVAPVDVEEIYGEKKKKRILVVGQVESDASIKYGCEKEMTNNDLVWAAYIDNPDAEIIYKPHPDVLTGHREKVSDPKEVAHIAKVVTDPLSMDDSLKTIDHVYTITSLAGFEALLRGIEVTCFGMPFYAGWGLTNDRQKCERRTRTLTLEELFAGAYLLYPKYLNLETNQLTDCEDTIRTLHVQFKQSALMKEAEARKEMLERKAKTDKPIVEVGEAWSDQTKPIAYMFGFNPWKREHMSHFFPEYRTAYVFGSAGIDRLEPYFMDSEEMVFIVWGFKEDKEILTYAKEHNIKLIRVEDGFVRSIALGAGHSLPMSIVADDQTLYFNSQEPSNLEGIYQTYDFQAEPDLLKKARTCIDTLLHTGISKYNHLGSTNVEEIYGVKEKKRILVIGQVETDASIKYGCEKEMTNNDLVWAAYLENPDAEIIYKPHPDVLTGHREKVSDPMEVSHIAKVVTEPLSLVDSLKTIDHVYTITSLAGFEALLRGIEVTCFGMPFYAGWGLTNDRQKCARRTRTLTLEELFAGAYLLYPKYINLETNELTDCEATIKVLNEKLKQNALMQEAEARKELLERKAKSDKPIVEVGEAWADQTKPIAYMFGFNPWKREHMSHFFPEYRTAYVFGSAGIDRLEPYFIDSKEIVFIVWGFKESEEILSYAQNHNIKLIRVEDGFVRSIALGAGHSLPMSIVADDQTLYFNSQEPSNLEGIYQTYDFQAEPDLLKKARTCIDTLLQTGISKYNHLGSTNVEAIYGVKEKKRILVIGQVETDASIKYGCEKELTNNDLVWAAYMENPDAEIIYKPHPDVLTGHREKVSDPMEVSHIAKVVTEPLSLVDSLKTIDHVYTITSLSGFEALLRGIEVTCFGMPFYAGWGLTNDRQKCARRTRTLTLEELFAGAYLLYPKYIDLETNELTDCEATIKVLNEKLKQNALMQEAEARKELLERKEQSDKPLVEVGEAWADQTKPIAYMFGFNPWKREHMSHFFPEYRTAYVFGSAGIDRLEPYFMDSEEMVFIVWGFKETEEILSYAKDHNIKLIRVEDGFVRSIGLGAGHSLPMSIVADDQTLYFNSQEPSNLEGIYQTYDFQAEPDLLKQARACMDTLVHTGISKYNHLGSTNVEAIYGVKTKKRILVIGQVESDASIKYGCSRKMTNNDLVRAAHLENPNAEIIYKPHPDVLTGHRDMISDPMAVSDIAKVVIEPLSLVDSLKTIDHVYTITSLSGFEALLRGIEVTCFGMPFYAGWGLTNDRQECDRRNRTLTIEELFAGAYLIYPRYINMETNELTDCESTIRHLLSMKKQQSLQQAEELFEKAIEYKKTNELFSAEYYLTHSVEMGYVKAESYIELADIYEQQKNYDQAISNYKKAISMVKDDNHLISHLRYKLALNERNEFGVSDHIKSNLYMALQLTKNADALYLLIDYIWEHEGVTQECIELVRDALKDTNVPSEKVLQFAAIVNDAGYYNEAINLYEKAIRLDETISHNKKYAALTALITQNRRDLVGGTRKELHYVKQLAAFEGHFETLIRNAEGNFCIVGNTESANQSGNGSRIDEYDLVIRFNDYSTDYPYSQDFGTKTDIWVKEGMYSNCRRRNVNDLKMVVLNEANAIHKSEHGFDLFSEFIDQAKPVEFVPHHVYTELVKQLGAVPSSELLVLYWIYKIQGPINAEQLYGFSFTDQTSYSFMNEYEKERQLFTSIIAETPKLNLEVAAAKEN